tara:strand:+ start:189 stop:611 length:423 start_codon:yes stop_codon:yes gene_type:complete
MLHITRGIANNVYFTLRETKKQAAGVGHFYFFKFVNDMTKQEAYLMSSNATSLSHTSRFSQLVFTEGTQVTLQPEGFFNYTVYEVTDNTLTDDSTLNALHIVEQGKAFVSDSNVNEVSYTEYTPTDNTNTTNNNTVYLNI